ncbi:nitroreductase family protein [Isoptericola croceus]|uniref:nitroreductase family protein n=1 Tax=Isoptericola croceus TaxID=3031406 RepID=UPI0023FA3BA7|nr:nitroreductase family protein [Isoptericola croceus]
MTVTGVFDVSEADRLLTTTRSVRRRLDLERPVPRSVIEEALEVAVQAPNANDQQGWRWLVLTEPAVKERLGQLFDISWRFHQKETWTRSGRRRNTVQARRNTASAAALAASIRKVPALVVPCVLGRPPQIDAIDEAWAHDARSERRADGEPAARIGAMRASNFYGSIFPAVWSFQLALRARGLGSTITSMHLPFERQVGELLGIPAGVTQVCLVPVAYTVGTTFHPARRVPASERTYWERWS